MSNVILRYESAALSLTDNLAPAFPNNAGTQFYSTILENPKYTERSRLTGSSSLDWQVNNIRKLDRDALWNWYKTTLGYGEKNLTVIDNRKRVLFDASWNDWSERWSSTGHRHGINLGLQSSFQWTPPAFAMYLMTANNLSNHLLPGGYSPSLFEGLLATTATRANGYSLRLPLNSSIGAAGTIDFKQQKGNQSITLFCQFKVGEITTGTSIHLLKITDEINTLSLDVTGTILDGNKIGCSIQNGVDTNNIQSTTTLEANTLYDVTFTYDKVNNQAYVYFWKSCTTAIWSMTNDYLYGSANIHDYMVYQQPTYYPLDTTYTTIYMLTSDGTNITTADSYLQNVMIFDDFISPLTFNFLRKLCWMWNNKTTGTWPK